MNLSTRRLAAAAFASLTLFSGSAALAADPEANLHYTGCSEQTTLLILPVALMPKLPAGFSYVSPAGGGLMAQIHLSGSQCASVDGGAGDNEVLAFALVTPPAALLAPAVQYYAIALGGYTSRVETLEQFDAWGIPDLIQAASVDIDLGQLPWLRVGKVKAQAETSTLTTRTLALGPPGAYEAGHTRAYYIRNGALISSFDAVYSAQTSMLATGTVTVTRGGFLPAGIFPSVGSHAFNYDLTVGFVEYY